MYVISGRNVNDCFAMGIGTIQSHGISRNSRNGRVLQTPWPVTTVYKNPNEKVLFSPARDANPFFHLYEALWMLAGRHDIAPLVKYAKQIAQYSDDGVTAHGAYGYRWRNSFGKDQLQVIAEALKKNPEDRRCMLQMWDTRIDLGTTGKDVPCNTMATLQINSEGKLDLAVFCRSNDIVWGCYGANAVHFAMLLEYMAFWIGVPVGTYSQISINWHAYLSTLEPVKEEWRNTESQPYSNKSWKVNPCLFAESGSDIEDFDIALSRLLVHDSLSFSAREHGTLSTNNDSLIPVAYTMLLAHACYRSNSGEKKYTEALSVLNSADSTVDWICAGKEWMARRYEAWKNKQ